ncbi:MAG: ABC transporter permease subunit [Thermoplasmata archaeon]|nr:ABC transporter permease subunit [Thermoplasmata archaeon]
MLAFSVGPVAFLLGTGLQASGGAAGVSSVLANPVNQRALANSVAEGAASAGAAVIVGYPVGVFFGRTSFPGRAPLLTLLLLPFVLPTVTVVTGIEELYGSGGWISSTLPALGALGQGFGGIVATNVLFNLPLVVLLTILGIETAPIDLEETVASLGGTPARAYRDVWGPPSWIGAAAGGILTFLFSALAFAGPILLGGAPWYTVEARIFTLSQIEAEPAAASVLALLALALVALPVLVYLLLTSRLTEHSHRSAAARRQPFRWGVTSGILAIVTSVALAMVTLLLIVTIARAMAPVRPDAGWGSGLLALFAPSIANALGVPMLAVVVNTLLFAAVASAIALLLAIVSSHAQDPRRRATGRIRGIAFVPLLVSPVILAFALASAWRPLLGGASFVGLLIIVSQAMLALPFAVQAVGSAARGISKGPTEAARSLGAAPWQAYLDVELPQVLGGIRVAVLFAFALGLGEFTATNFLATGPTTTLSVALYRLEGIRLGSFAPAVAGILALVSLVVFLGIAASGERRVDVL